jgi:hypothetical protein
VTAKYLLLSAGMTFFLCVSRARKDGQCNCCPQRV